MSHPGKTSTKLIDLIADHHAGVYVTRFPESGDVVATLFPPAWPRRRIFARAEHDDLPELLGTLTSVLQVRRDMQGEERN